MLLIGFVACALPVGSAPAGPAGPIESAAVPPGVLTNFEQIWQLPEPEQREWHRVQLDYDVYYYDPLWKALWGRCGDVDNFVSLGTKTFPIKVGQRIRIEGRIQPSRGMLVEDARVTVLADSVPLEVVSTTGDVGNIPRFDKRLVKMSGYVDRQAVRDANHLEIHLVTEGRLVQAQLLIQNDVPLPQLQGRLVRAEGVYFARSDPAGGPAKIELWIQRVENIQILETLERDPRFEQPATELEALASLPDNSWVRVVGAVAGTQPGKGVKLRRGQAEITIQTPQTLAVAAGDEVEAIGLTAKQDGALVLRQGLYRRERPVVTSVSQLWNLPDAERQQWYRVRFEYTVYFYDPAWKALWGRAGGRDDYLSFGTQSFPIKPGQKILIEGVVFPAKGILVEEAKVSVLEEKVDLIPLPTRGHIANIDRFNKAYVTVEGLVDRQMVTDAQHLELDLVVEGRSVTARVMVPDAAKSPNWEGALVKVKGVYSATLDPIGGLPLIEIWTGADRIERTGAIDTDQRFQVALTPIDQLAEAGSGQLVRVEGTVRTQQPGRSLTIRDETGQTNLFTAQGRPVHLGDRVEAVGYPVLEAGTWSLREGIYRRSQTAAVPRTGELPRIRLADQLREMPPDEAARSYPVQLSGIVTWSRPKSDFIFIRDASGGVCVFRPPGAVESHYIGTKVEVTGVSAPGRFTPVVLAASIQASATMEVPEPRRVTLEQALTGIEEAEFVTMTGYVRAVEQEGPWVRLELTTSGGEFQAMVPPNERWAKLPGSVVRVKGVCSAKANSKRQLIGIQVWVPTSRFVDIEEAAPEDPFAVEARPIASLRQFGALQSLNRRVRVSGVVVHQAAGRLVHIQDGLEGLLVLSRDVAPLIPGDRIEAVGFPGLENSRLVLREAVYRKVSTGDEPAPLAISSFKVFNEEQDGLLARVQGTLVDLGAQEKGTRLMLQNEETFFEAMIDQPQSSLPDHWVPGSRLELTGVHEIKFDEYRRPHSVRLQLRNVSDVRVLQRPSAWTVRRVVAVAGVLAVGVVLGFGWVLALRRRVRQQTGVIREQVENEKAARLDAALARASKLESVGVLAGGIAHDFNNLLTVVIGNLSLARMDRQIDAETERCLVESEKAAARAKDLTQQLLTFSKGGEPVRKSTLLPDIVREASQFGLHGSNVRCEFDIPPDLWPAEVDKGQIAQVVHNLIINASQAMSAGGLIRIGLRNEVITSDARAGLVSGRYVRLSISDTGAGIEAKHLARIFEPYFTTKPQGSGLGLATVYSVVKKHEGHVDVHSKVGHGTTFNVWLPAAAQAPATAVTNRNSAPAKTGRVLIMDDEVSIRQLGSAVVKRMGLEVTAVNDGAAVVTEYAAASAAGCPYDLVILDLTVPGGMGGAEAMEKLRGLDRNVRAIVSSGYSSDPVMANHRNYGFCGRVPKPYTATDLIDVVKTVMQKPMGATKSMAAG